MSLINRLIEPMKDYISFRDFIFHLSSVNDEPLYEVVTYLLHHDLNSIRFYNIDTDYKIIKFEPFEFDSIKEFLKEVQDALAISACDWVFSSSESLDELIETDRRLLTTTVMKAMHCFFKRSELLSFEPLNGLLHFEDVDVKRKVVNKSFENPIDRLIEENRRKYIAVSDFVNNLSKFGSFGAGSPLKITVKQIIEDATLNNINLYKLRETEYLLVSQTDSFEYKDSAEILRSFYNVLDNSQTGIVSSDRELFRDFYFAYSEVAHLISSNSKAVEKESSIHIDDQSSNNNSKPSYDSSVINNLGENQRLLITYSSFTVSDMTCLIIDENPACINSNANYLMHQRMIYKAIKAGSLILNDSDEIPVKEVKTWLANHSFIYKGFNDNLSNNNDKTGVAVVGHAERKSYEQLVEELATANNRIKQQDLHIQSLKEKLIQPSNMKSTQLYDWQGMSQYNYPPELHLALMIWEKSYILNEIDNPHMKDHSQRFNTIAEKMGLNQTIHGAALFNRLSKITNPQINKQKNDVEKFIEIKGLYIKDLTEGNPQR
ncbi:hypothetical protein ACTXGK_12700 [Psychrobacter sp. T6-5]|uniref:hypothetical protein n=1 Tax=Psychrobacter sp. T6-5 TaxID=3457451 RepID=UPI003FD37725